MYKLIILVVLLLGASVVLNNVISSSGEKKTDQHAGEQAKSQAKVTNEPMTAQMFNAVHGGNYELIDKLIKKDPELVNRLHPQGGTFINCATTANDLKMINYLLDHGANPDGNALCGTTGLQIAVRGENQAIAQTLISRGANINALGEDNNTVLDIALKAGKPGMIQLLLQNGAKSSKDLPKPAPKKSSKSTIEEMFNAVHAKDYGIINKLLKKDPELVNKNHAQGGTFINCAVSANDHKMLKYLLDHGANPNKNALCGTTGLQLAIKGEKQAIAQTLISRGANINTVGEENKTALDTAISVGKQDMIAFLRKNGAKSAKDLPKPAPKTVNP